METRVHLGLYRYSNAFFHILVETVQSKVIVLDYQILENGQSLFLCKCNKPSVGIKKKGTDRVHCRSLMWDHVNSQLLAVGTSGSPALGTTNRMLGHGF